MKKTVAAAMFVVSCCAASAEIGLAAVHQDKPKSDWRTIYSEVSGFSPDTIIQGFPVMVKMGKTDPFSSSFLVGADTFSKPFTLAEIEKTYGPPDKKEVVFFSEGREKKIKACQVWTWGAAVFKADAADSPVDAFGYDMIWVNEHFQGLVSDKPEPYSSLEEARQFALDLNGGNELSIKNPSKKAKASVVLRSRSGGKVLEIPARKEVKLTVPDGHYIIYYEYSDRPGVLFTMKSFLLMGYGAKAILGEVESK